jgi:hypothetical protein
MFVAEINQPLAPTANRDQCPDRALDVKDDIAENVADARAE